MQNRHGFQEEGYGTLGLRKLKCSQWCMSKLEYIINVDELAKC